MRRSEGTLELWKEFLLGFVAEIGIDPGKGRGAIIFFYELHTVSLIWECRRREPND